jgi:hypothetical protein
LAATITAAARAVEALLRAHWADPLSLIDNNNQCSDEGALAGLCLALAGTNLSFAVVKTFDGDAEAAAT